jgi:hypothetical protein
MMSGLWYSYLRAFDTDMRKQNRQIILVVDNAPRVHTHPHPNGPLQNYTMSNAAHSRLKIFRSFLEFDENAFDPKSHLG